jgi:small neutral amino acid transporter SnatA (MarC family)
LFRALGKVSMDQVYCHRTFADCAISILLCYGFAERLARILGVTGMTVITQLSSFFLVCIGVQIAWNGIKALLESLALHIG